jgi:hypothetical protein
MNNWARDIKLDRHLFPRTMWQVVELSADIQLGVYLCQWALNKVSILFVEYRQTEPRTREWIISECWLCFELQLAYVWKLMFKMKCKTEHSDNIKNDRQHIFGQRFRFVF